MSGGASSPHSLPVPTPSPARPPRPSPAPLLSAHLLSHGISHRISHRISDGRYGALTGLSKKMTRTIYGEKQFKKWRRGYDVKPPKVSSFSRHYPGNDQRYVENMLDVRLSFKESVIRSLERGSLSLHRKLPHSESLKVTRRPFPFPSPSPFPLPPSLRHAGPSPSRPLSPSPRPRLPPSPSPTPGRIAWSARSRTL